MKLVYLTILFLSLLVINHLKSSNEKWEIGARQSGLGFCGVAIIDNWSSVYNQAALAFLNNYSINFYFEQRFLIKELSFQALNLVLPTNKNGTFAIDLTYFGFKNYNEASISLAYGILLGKNLAIGSKISYLNTHYAEGYGNKGNVIGNVSIFFNHREKFFWGVHIFNINRAKLAPYYDERIPTIIYTGLSYKLTKKILSTFELEKDFSYPLIYKIGIEYNLFNNFLLLVGLNIHTSSYFTFGIGYESTKISVNIAFSYNNYLGYTPHISFSYNFKKINKSQGSEENNIF